MTKLRKLFIALLSLVMIASFSAFAVGCNDKQDDDAFEILVAIQDKTSEIEIGDTGSFKAKIDGDDNGTIVWTSSNSSILSVSPSGAFEAKTTGDVQVTATYAGDSSVKDIMNVTVKKSNIGVLAVEDDNFSLMLGNTSKLNPYVQYNSKIYSEGVSFSYVSSDPTVAYVDSNGNIIAMQEGNATIEIKTNFRNDEISTLVNIAVKDLSFISIFAPSNRNSTIYTLNYDNHTTGFTYTYEVYENLNKVDAPTVSWTSSNPSVATVTDGVVTAVAPGETTITASFVDGQGNTHTDIDKVIVAKPIYDTQKLIDDYLVGDAFNIPSIVKYPDLTANNVISVTYNGVEAYNTEDKTLNKDVVIGSADTYRDIVVSTALAKYAMKVRVTNAIIRSADDLVNVQDKLAICKANIFDQPDPNRNNRYLNGVYFDGYIEFADDIDMAGVATFAGIANYVNRAQYDQQTSKKNGFHGTIDGKGFTIKNLTLEAQKNFIVYVGAGAVVRNLNFDNLTINGKGSALFGKVYADATFDGINVKGQINVTGSYDKDNGSGFLFSLINGTGVKFENSTIWLTNDNVALIDSKNFVDLFGVFSSSNAYDFASIFVNVIVVSKTDKFLSTNVAKTVTYKSSDFTAITYYSGEVDYYLGNGWDKDQESTEANCYQAGQYILTKAGEPNKEYTINPLGHDLVLDSSTGKWVCATCHEEAKVVNVTTELREGLTAQMLDDTLDENVTITYAYDGYNLPCSVTGGKIEFTSSDPTTYSTDELASKLVISTSDGKAYIAYVDLYSLIIKDETDFLNMHLYTNQIDASYYDGLFLFEKDLELDMSGNPWKGENVIKSTGTTSLYGGFSGTIDFNGAKITNFSFNSGAYTLIEIAYGCTIKNLKLLQTSNASYGILARRIAGGINIENVTVELTSDTASIEWTNTNGILLGFLCRGSNVNLKDLTFIYSGEATDKLSNASIIAGTQPAYSTHSYDYKGTVYAENVVVAGIENMGALLFNGPRHTTVAEYAETVSSPFTYGNGLEIVGDVEGITLYKTVEDYEAKENAIIQNITVLPDVSGVHAKEKLDLVALTTSEEDALSKVKIYSNYTYDKSDITKKGLVIIPGEAGDYTYYFMTDDYAWYKVTVHALDAIPLEQITITEEFVYDLKDGFNVNTILAAAGQQEDATIETITIGGQVFEADEEGNVAFGEPSDMSTVVKSLPKDGAQTVIMTGEENEYSLTNFHLYSLLVSDSDELREMNLYQAISGSFYYAVIGFDEDVTFSGSFTNDYTLAKGKAVSGGGFNGVLDGRGYSLISFDSSKASLISSGNGCTLKNLTFDYTSANSSYNGPLVAYITGGCTVSDITVKNKGYTSGGKGALLGLLYAYGDVSAKDLVLSNITIINDFVPAGDGTAFDKGQALIAGYYKNNGGSSYLFRANIIVDNINIVSTGGATAIRLINDAYRTSNTRTQKVLDLGSGIKIADGKTGVTYYSSLTDYEAKTNGIVAEVTEKEVDIPKNAKYDVAKKILAQDETLDYIFYADEGTDNGGNPIDVTKYQKGSANSIVRFSKLGTWYVSVRTTDYHFYILKVTVVEPIQVDITTEFNYDLASGFNVNTLLEEAGKESDFIESVEIGGQSFIPDADGNVTFGAVASMTNDIKLLAKDGAQTIELIGGSQYSLSNFHLWSILVSDAAEYKTAKSYQTTAKVGDIPKYYAIIGFDADVTLNKLESADILGPTTASLTEGFCGVIDGRGFKVSNFDNTDTAVKEKAFTTSAHGAILRNINIVASKNAMYGLFGKYSSGVTIEKVTLTTTITSINGGFLLYQFSGTDKNIILKDVTVINTAPSTVTAANNFAGSWIGNPMTSADNHFTGKIIVDNVTFVSYNKQCKLMSAVYGEYGTNNVGAIGSVIEVAKDADSGITIYTSQADYEAKTNGITPTTEVVEQSISVTTGTALTVSTLVAEGKTYAYAAGSVKITGKNSTKTLNSDTVTITYSTAGTFKLLVVATDYTCYVYTVVVS